MPIKIKNEDEYQKLLKSLARKMEASTSQNGESQKVEKPKIRTNSTTSKTAKASEPESPVKTAKKRQGVKESPILLSLQTCTIETECSETHATILFKGARLFTLNETYAMLQYRSYIIFQYKKIWQILVAKALSKMGKKKPHFNGACKVTYFRQGSKKVDRDSITSMFKYIVDALKDDAKNHYEGIFPDDNPEIIYDDDKYQTIGDHLIGIRVDLIRPQPTLDLRDEFSLLSNPPKKKISPAQDPEKNEPTQATSKKPRKKLDIKFT